MAFHQDVILDCIDDADISIRLRALELVVGMVSSENLQTVVERLMRQLRPSTVGDGDGDDGADSRNVYEQGEDTYTGRPAIKPAAMKGTSGTAVPEDYKLGLIKRILDMCSRDLYANIDDFDWYLDVLMQLIGLAPAATGGGGRRYGADMDGDYDDDDDEGDDDIHDVSENIGLELRNVSVRVSSVRPEATRCADVLVRKQIAGSQRVLLHAGWIVGEYAGLLNDPHGTVSAMLTSSSSSLPHDVLAMYIQAIPKIYSVITGNEDVPWTKSWKSIVTLLTSSVVSFLEPHATCPDIEVQERAIEFLELFRVAVDAIAAIAATDSLDSQQPHENEDNYNNTEPPRILTQAIPALFTGLELKPVSANAQRKVPFPPNLKLDEPINPHLHELIAAAASWDVDILDSSSTEEETDTDTEEGRIADYYYKRPTPIIHASSSSSSSGAIRSIQNIPASQLIDRASSSGPGSYQYQTAPRSDDPFQLSAAVSPNPLRGEDVDVDSIPVMPLNLDTNDLLVPPPAAPKIKKRVEIVRDEEPEELAGSVSATAGAAATTSKKAAGKKGRGKASGLEGFSLEEDEEEKAAKEKRAEEVRLARREVERVRRELAERERVEREAAEAAKVKAEEVGKVKAKKKKKVVKEGEEGGTVKKKKKKVQDAGGEEGEAVEKKKKAKKKVVVEGAEGAVKKTKKKKAKAEESAAKGAAEAVPEETASADLLSPSAETKTE